MTQKPHPITRLWFYAKDHRRTIVLAAITVLVYFFQPARDFQSVNYFGLVPSC